RDSLRLEAGLCLYGNDIDETRTPVEAALRWLIPTARRDTGGFPGADVILAQLKSPPPTVRMGILFEEDQKPRPPPPRQGHEVITPSGEVLGVLTSGGPAPSLKNRGVGMAYLPRCVW